MSIPFFFSENIAGAGQQMVLDEETSKHIVQVLRMQKGAQIRLTDGNGNAAVAEIAEPHKKHSSVQILSSYFVPRSSSSLTIGISLIKNPSRFEWFLEKAAELGTAEIIPLLCDRTEKQHSRQDRFMNICRSAMLQSAQTWLTRVQEPAKFADVVKNALHSQKLIAHCGPGEKKQTLPAAFNSSSPSRIVLIGPEGDFSPDEIRLSAAYNFEAVSLGDTRLRTETAGIFAAVAFKIRDN